MSMNYGPFEHYTEAVVLDFCFLDITNFELLDNRYFALIK